MRLALVFSLCLAACGGSVDGASPAPSPSRGGVIERPELPAPASAWPCGAANRVVEVPESAHGLAVSNFRLAWLEEGGAMVVLEGAEKRTIATEVTSIAGSKTMFAFSLAAGGVGTHRVSTALHPSLRADRVVPSFEDLAWVSADDGVLRRGEPDGEPRELAHGVLPVLAVDGDSTWYLTDGAVHHDDAVVATIEGSATKMFAAGDRAYVGFGDHVDMVGAGVEAPIQVWQNPYVDFAADAREVVVAEEHALDRMHGSDTRQISLGTCTVRELTMDDQLIYALVSSESGSMIVRLPR